MPEENEVKKAFQKATNCLDCAHHAFMRDEGVDYFGRDSCYYKVCTAFGQNKLPEGVIIHTYDWVGRFFDLTDQTERTIVAGKKEGEPTKSPYPFVKDVVTKPVCPKFKSGGFMCSFTNRYFNRVSRSLTPST
jgi:hypothetical protein